MNFVIKMCRNPKLSFPFSADSSLSSLFFCSACSASTDWAWCCWSLTTWSNFCSTLHASSTSVTRTSKKGIGFMLIYFFFLGSGSYSVVSFIFGYSFTLWALLFVIARLLTLTLSVLTFGFGLPRTENNGFSFAEGNFNVLTVR